LQRLLISGLTIKRMITSSWNTQMINEEEAFRRINITN